LDGRCDQLQNRLFRRGASDPRTRTGEERAIPHHGPGKTFLGLNAVGKHPLGGNKSSYWGQRRIEKGPKRGKEGLRTTTMQRKFRV